MAEFDTDRALFLVESGITYDVIAKSLDVPRSTLLRELNALKDSAHARARTNSAEAWLGHGIAALQDALDKHGNIDATVACAYARACAAQAAIRNPAYRIAIESVASPK